MKYCFLLLLPLLLMARCTPEQDEEQEIQQDQSPDTSLSAKVAKAYGIDSFDRVSSLYYEFTIELPDTTIVRKWKWEPQSGTITYWPADTNAAITYTRSQLDTSNERMVNIDKRFINDNYWLLFPFHLVWDEDVETTVNENVPMPLSKDNATELVVKYGDAGYTPGDVYKLYLDDRHIIKEWTFLQGGSEDRPSRRYWAEPEQHGPIRISTSHYSPDSSSNIAIRNIRVE